MAVEHLTPHPAGIDQKPDRQARLQQLHEEIRYWKQERNAVILAHLYERIEVQNIADHVGDSLGLSQAAAKTDADVIVF